MCCKRERERERWTWSICACFDLWWYLRINQSSLSFVFLDCPGSHQSSLQPLICAYMCCGYRGCWWPSSTALSTKRWAEYYPLPLHFFICQFHSLASSPKSRYNYQQGADASSDSHKASWPHIFHQLAARAAHMEKSTFCHIPHRWAHRCPWLVTIQCHSDLQEKCNDYVPALFFGILNERLLM